MLCRCGVSESHKDFVFGEDMDTLYKRVLTSTVVFFEMGHATYVA